MRKIIFYSFLFFLLVVYILSIIFDFIPISTKIILEAISFIICFVILSDSRYRLKKEYKTIIIWLVIAIIWDLITSLINGETQFHFIKYLTPVIGSIFAAHVIYKFAKRRIKTPEQLLYLVVLMMFFESILTVLMKSFPPLYELLDAFLVFDFRTDVVTDIFDIPRFFGIGNAYFFGVLAPCCVAIMPAVYLMNETESLLKKVFLIVMWIVISIVSFFVARWTITIVAVSVGLFFVYQGGKNVFRTLGVLAILAVGIWVAYIVTMDNIDPELQKWAFSSFMNDSAQGDHSADYVKDWWLNTRFEFKTFLIGDAKYTDPIDGYYKHVDVGYFREIFYGGIIGLLINLYLHVKILKMTYRYNPTKSFKYFLIFLMFGYMAILAKGDANMMTFFILFLVFYSDGAIEYVPYRKGTLSKSHSIEKK